MNNDQKVYAQLAEVALDGVRMENFLNSDIGKAFSKKAENEIQVAQEEFSRLQHPLDIDKVSELHLRIIIPIKVMEWASNIINESNIALEQMRQMEDETGNSI